MSNERLKKKAAEFEQKKQFDRALEVYLQIIEQAGTSRDEPDVTIYNRVGDLYLRLNKVGEAVGYYEQAVDLYTDGGYLNNAIALCNKILRHAPNRNSIYYKLGKISAKKGFNSDAKKNFLEYADRMHKAGRDSEAFKALQEFADLCPGQDDIRLMLADQLAKAGKTAEAVEQLQILHESLDAEGRTTEAEATVQRMQSLDPEVQPRRSKTPRPAESGGLVFLDLGGSPPRPRPKIDGLQTTSLAPETRRPKTPPHVQPSPEIEQLSVEPSTPIEELPGLEIDHEIVPELEPMFDTSAGALEISPLEGLESAADPATFELGVTEAPAESMIEGLIREAPDELGTPTPFGGELHITESESPSPFGDELQLDEPVNPTPYGTEAEPVGSTADPNDPLAGLSILEDDRFYVDNPLSDNALVGVESSVESDMPAPPPPKPAPKAEPEPVEIGSLEEDEEEEPVAAASAKKRPKRRDEEEEEDEEEDEEESAETERKSRSRSPTRSKPRLVSPVRPRGKPTTPPRAKKSADAEPAEPARKGASLNPFQSRVAAKKTGSRSTAMKSGSRGRTPEESPKATTPRSNERSRSEKEFVDLADWLRDDSAPRSTRMIASDDTRIGEEEQEDFSEMLEKFKAGVAANVDEGDYDSHFDLGVAYREMGLIDEAIAEFQKALRGATHRMKAYEALGQCFIDRGEHDVAITVLSRALREPGMEDEDLLGALYLLGYASEQSRKPRDAAAYYQRVFAIDIDFRDVSKRLKAMTKAAAK